MKGKFQGQVQITLEVHCPPCKYVEVKGYQHGTKKKTTFQKIATIMGQTSQIDQAWIHLGPQNPPEIRLDCVLEAIV